MFYCLIVCIHRDVVIINSRLHSNAGYGEESVAVHLENRYSITKSSKGSFWLIILDIFIFIAERKDLFQQYKVELNKIHILAKDLDLVAIIGEGVLFHNYSLSYVGRAKPKCM